MLTFLHVARTNNLASIASGENPRYFESNVPTVAALIFLSWPLPQTRVRSVLLLGVQDILKCSRDLINPKLVIYFFDVTALFAQSISEDLVVSSDATIQYSNPSTVLIKRRYSM